MVEEETCGSFRLSCRRPEWDVVVVDIVGDLDLQTVPQARAFLRHATARSPRHLLVDLSRVTFLSSSGISLLVGYGTGEPAAGTRLHLVGARENPQVARPLALLGLLDHFDTAPDVDTCTARLQGAPENGEPLRPASGARQD